MRPTSKKHLWAAVAVAITTLALWTWLRWGLPAAPPAILDRDAGRILITGVLDAEGGPPASYWLEDSKGLSWGGSRVLAPVGKDWAIEFAAVAIAPGPVEVFLADRDGKTRSVRSEK
jgi:hypothetical protein